MNKKADFNFQDILDRVRRAGSGIGQGLSNAGSSIQDWYSNLDPDLKRSILTGLAGAAGGGLIGGGIASMGTHDPEERSPIMSPALLGALLGGAAGFGIPYGLKLMSNKAQFPGEESQPMGSVAVDKALEPMLTHPATTLGTGAGLAALYAGQDPVRKAWEASGKGLRKPMGMMDSLRNLYAGARKGSTAPISSRNLLAQMANRAGKTWGGLELRPGGGKLAVLAPLLGLTGGGLLDKYLRGDY